MNARWLVVGFAACVMAGVGGMADDEQAAQPKQDNGVTVERRDQSPDTAAVCAQAEAFVRAFNAGDASAIGQLFTSDARAIDATGEVAVGREAIEREYASLFRENPGLRLEINVKDVHAVSSDAAIDEGTTRVIPKNGTPPVVNRYSAVSVKHDGKWLLANVREYPGERSAQDQLKALEWLVGDWVDESADSAMQSTCKWSDDKQALVRDFTIRSRGKVVMTGTQRIGWDPQKEQIKSWEFDSQGGHGEGLWARIGDEWVVKATAVLQDGRSSTATHVITPENPSTCHWRTTDRTVGGQVIPSTQEFVMVRPASRPGTR
jgi:uncharacterized protein (TIGR02246 family)